MDAPDSDYEAMRLANIARNRQMLADLGLSGTTETMLSMGLSPAAKAKAASSRRRHRDDDDADFDEKAAARERQRRKKARKATPTLPTRVSARRRGIEAAAIAIESESNGRFIFSGAGGQQCDRKAVIDASLAITKQTRKETATSSPSPSPSSLYPQSLEELLPGAEEAAFQALRVFRRRRCRELGIEPYKIAQNRTLCELVRRLPVTLDDMLDVWGIGESRLAAYGTPMLEILDEHRDAIQEDQRKAAEKEVEKDAAAANEVKKEGGVAGGQGGGAEQRSDIDLAKVADTLARTGVMQGGAAMIEVPGTPTSKRELRARARLGGQAREGGAGDGGTKGQDSSDGEGRTVTPTFVGDSPQRVGVKVEEEEASLARDTGGKKRKRKRPSSESSEAAVAAKALGWRVAMPSTPEQLEPHEEAAFEALLEWKRARARQLGFNDPCIICHNRTLVELVRRLPTDEDELLDVWGVGHKRLVMHGHLMIEALQPFRADLLAAREVGGEEVKGRDDVMQATLGKVEQADEEEDVRDNECANGKPARGTSIKTKVKYSPEAVVKSEQEDEEEETADSVNGEKEAADRRGIVGAVFGSVGRSMRRLRSIISGNSQPADDDDNDDNDSDDDVPEVAPFKATRDVGRVRATAPRPSGVSATERTRRDGRQRRARRTVTTKEEELVGSSAAATRSVSAGRRRRQSRSGKVPDERGDGRSRAQRGGPTGALTAISKTRTTSRTRTARTRARTS